MRSFVTCTVLASVASMVSAIGFEYPEGVPALEKRQDPGTPRYACHENCGTLITLGRTEGYCSTAEWSTRYDACMACANEFGIWMYYQSGVTNAAKACGQTPNPAPSGGAVTSAAAPVTTSAPAAASSSAPAAEQPASSSAAAPPANEQSSSAAAAASSTGAAAPATTLTTAASSGSSGAAATTSAAGTGSSAATATRVTSIGTSVVIVCAAWAWSLL
ncbi:uncharacterized protein CTRU02_207513 [Colletotrichum truncatum]|uniref:Uncharacterized protein n=1 Tax=Colletotrichum truncatum TaxID=5467 RepID=A0ACC3Z117_COLTU